MNRQQSQRIETPSQGIPRSVQRYVWRPRSVPISAEWASDYLLGKKVAVVGRSADDARVIVERLVGQGAQAAHFHPQGREMEEQARRFCQGFGHIDGVVDLNIADPFSAGDFHAWELQLQRTVAILKALYSDWIEETDANRLFYLVVTRMGGLMGCSSEPQNVGPIEVLQPLGGIWAGLAKGLPREIANCNVRVLDLCPASWERVGELLIREIGNWGLFEIGYFNGRRFTLCPMKEEVGEPALQIGPTDTLLLSGGGRGIGFELAKSLARDLGCRVVITGRIPLKALGESWVDYSEEEFKRHLHSLLKDGIGDGSLARSRRETERVKRVRQLKQNLEEAARHGLRIEYRQCDFTSLADVKRLLADFDWESCGIIHNAGIDSPVRLSGKGLDDFLQTVRVKVNGFLHLWQALGEKKPKLWCSVGSLTGRWGGMVGQMDYGAANEGLARLGWWASSKVGFPVKTLCWPTWERLGMISNYDATLKYMSPLEVGEGVEIWRRELMSVESGEICFIGRIGKALTPILLKGYPASADIPDIETLRSRCFFLGDVIAFRPFHSMRSRNTIDSTQVPAMFTMGKGPSLLPSLLLEFALSLGDWIVPEGWMELELVEIRDLRVHLSVLSCRSERFVLEKEGIGKWSDGHWVVETRIDRLDPEQGQTPVARLDLIYAKERPEPVVMPVGTRSPPFGIVLPDMEGGPWTGLLFKPAEWEAEAGGGGICAATVASFPGDLWATPFPPCLRLPSGALENVFWAARSYYSLPAPLTMLKVGKMHLFDLREEWGSTLRGEPPFDWFVTRKGRVQLALHGLEYK